jgi:RNA polymerase sigma-70 factor (ECF subfamily)
MATATVDVLAQAEAVAAARPLAAEELFRAYSAFVAKLLWRLGAPVEDVEDLVQEVFLIAHRRGGYTPGPAKPTTWLAEIAVRVLRARKSKSQRRLSLERTNLKAEGVDESASPAELADARRRLACVELALDKLDLDRRAVFVLAELYGERCEDIAQSLGVPLGTIHSRLSRARKQFRDAYARIAHSRRKGST